jgi:hypothetical protein
MSANVGYHQVTNGRYASSRGATTAVDAAPDITGLAGANPLGDSFESTIYPDLGLMTPHPLPIIAGWPHAATPDNADPATWRDTWMEQAIKLAIV